jgi:hypothetical protein
MKLQKVINYPQLSIYRSHKVHILAFNSTTVKGIEDIF